MSSGSVDKIDTVAFDETISAIESGIDGYNSARTRINNTTAQLLELWEGEGKSKFQEVYDKLKTELEDEEENLIVVRDDLKAMRQTYEDWDATTAKGAGNE